MNAMNSTEWTAIRADEENGCEDWWDALKVRYPKLAGILSRNGVAVIRSELFSELAALPGFDDGPDHAPTPVIDCGGEDGQSGDGLPHGVFGTLE